MKYIFWILVILTVVALMPLALIWSVNTLFNTGIEYTFFTWLAALLLAGLFGKTSVTTK